MAQRLATAAALVVRHARFARPTRTAQFALARRTLSTVHQISPPADDQEPEPPAKTFTVAARLDDGLLALRPSMGVSSASVKPGALLSLGVCIGTAVAHEAWWFDAVVALLVSGALLLHACRVRSGLRTYCCDSFWSVHYCVSVFCYLL